MYVFWHGVHAVGDDVDIVAPPKFDASRWCLEAVLYSEVVIPCPWVSLAEDAFDICGHC